MSEVPEPPFNLTQTYSVFSRHSKRMRGKEINDALKSRFQELALPKEVFPVYVHGMLEGGLLMVWEASEEDVGFAIHNGNFN